ncbi:hypothetical protein XENOCAPTIV_019657, partial [Xenoophorus captivus]
EYNTSEPNSNLVENFCRNPDSRSEGPWCFTTDPTVQKETCRVPKCGTVTMGGHTCLQWKSREAAALSRGKEFIPEVVLEGNKCRNPDNDPEGPWCYVDISGNITIDYCDLELCGTVQTHDPRSHQHTGLPASHLSLFTCVSQRIH